MGLKEDLEEEARRIFREQWKQRDGTVVPEAEDLALKNEAVLLDGTVLYADMSGSTRMVDQYKPHFAAEIYKTFLRCTALLVIGEGGTITAYDGDRIMGVFVGDKKNTRAVRCGLKINFAIKKIINPAIRTQYPDSPFFLSHVVGIDTSKLWVTKTGARGANDLVWVGRAANYAAKLTELDADFPTWITDVIYKNMDESVQLSNGRTMWETMIWNAMNKMTIYRSNWTWQP